MPLIFDFKKSDSAKYLLTLSTFFDQFHIVFFLFLVLKLKYLTI